MSTVYDDCLSACSTVCIGYWGHALYVLSDTLHKAHRSLLLQVKV